LEAEDDDEDITGRLAFSLSGPSAGGEWCAMVFRSSADLEHGAGPPAMKDPLKNERV
jgi:hypothetical protein